MDLSGLNSLEEEESNLRLYRSLDIMCFVVYGLVFVVGALGNGVVVWAAAFKLKTTASTVWFLNLAVSDLLFAATLPLSIMHQALGYQWPLGKVMCKVYFTLDSLTMFASGYLLVVIGVDRCVSVAWPSSAWVQMNRCGAWRRKASCVSAAVVWALAAVLSSPLFFTLDTPSTCRFSNSSSLFSDESDDYEPSPSVVRLDVLIITYNFLGFVVPLVVIVSCYAVILWRRRNGGSPAAGGRRSPLGRPFSVRAAITASFFLCYAPYHVQSIHIFDVFGIGWSLASCLLALYHCLNPLLYTIVRRDLRNKESILEVLESAFAEEEEPRSEPSADLPLSDEE